MSTRPITALSGVSRRDLAANGIPGGPSVRDAALGRFASDPGPDPGPGGSGDDPIRVPPRPNPDDGFPGGRLPDEGPGAPADDGPTGPLPGDLEAPPAVDEPADMPVPPPARLPGTGNPSVHLE